MEKTIINESKSVNNILKGVVISIISTLILLVIFSAILTYTNITEKFIEPVIMIISAVSIFIGSSIGILKIKKKGILNGAIIGGLYFFIIYIISSIINGNFLLSGKSFIMIAVGILFGILGGIVGVNKK